MEPCNQGGSVFIRIKTKVRTTKVKMIQRQT